MKRLALVLLLWPLLVSAANVPTGVRVVDVRGIVGQPELDTWLGSLQGTLNRQPAQTPVFVVRTDVDALWADTLVRMYHLTRETLAPGTLLAAAKPALTGQVLYDPKQPWSRLAAVVEAARAPGAAIASDVDLGLPTVADLRGRWADHAAALQAALDAAAHPAGVILAPESGHLLADAIAARQWPAFSLQPGDADDNAKLTALLARLPADTPLLGAPELPADDKGAAFWNLTGKLLPGGQALQHARYAANLSAWARFPATRPLLQGHDEVTQTGSGPMLVLVYDGGDGVSDGAQSLDYAVNTLLPLLSDPALAALPVGIEVPMSLHDAAPGLYQALLARQRFTAAEMVAAPNGAGWTLPMLLKDPSAFLARTAAQAQAMDLTGVVLHDIGDTAAYDKELTALAAGGLRGALVRPVDTNSLPDKKVRTNRALGNFVALTGDTRVHTGEELRTFVQARAAALGRVNALQQDADTLYTVIFLDPYGVPPAVLSTLLPEMQQTFTLATPSQAFRSYAESRLFLPWLQAQPAPSPGAMAQRKAPLLHVSAPTTTAAHPAADAPLPVQVTITGDAPVAAARLLFQGPDGRLGAADLRQEGAVWRATLPPLLIGGKVTITARVVDGTGFGEAYSTPLTVTLPIVDSDKDGADDTLEEYLGTDPHNWDTDGDGLPDGLDPNPLVPNHDVAPLCLPVTPPADAPFLTAAGASTTDTMSRTVPAGGAVTYRLPLTALPAGTATLRLFTLGAGTVAVDGKAATPLDAMPNQPLMTDVPVRLSDAALTLTLTAGAQPLRLFSFGLVTGAAGPYILPAQLSSPAPFAGVPLHVRVTVYSPDGVKKVQLRYGSSLQRLALLPLTPAQQLGNVVYEGTVPGQPGPTLFYDVVAEDTKGHTTAAPFTALSVGHIAHHTLALLATRDMRGSWLPMPIWGVYGRALLTGTGEDHCIPSASLRPGSYTAWLLAAPWARGIDVSIRYRSTVLHDNDRDYLAATVPAGRPDGWFRLGDFTLEKSARVTVSVTPHGDAGYCAYGEVVLTQDDRFTPPLTHSTVDWFNSLHISGLVDGQHVRAATPIHVQVAGNIDAVQLIATPLHGAARGSKEIELEANDDGSYLLDPEKMLPGEWKITAKGLRVTKEDDVEVSTPILSVNVLVTIGG